METKTLRSRKYLNTKTKYLYPFEAFVEYNLINLPYDDVKLFRSNTKSYQDYLLHQQTLLTALMKESYNLSLLYDTIESVVSEN